MRGFKQFLLRGNVVDLAVGIVIGAAFAGLVVLRPANAAPITIPTAKSTTFPRKETV